MLTLSITEADFHRGHAARKYSTRIFTKTKLFIKAHMHAFPQPAITNSGQVCFIVHGLLNHHCMLTCPTQTKSIVRFGPPLNFKLGLTHLLAALDH